MYNLHTADVVPVVNEKTTSYVKGERARFPNPRSGFEYVAEIIRSGIAAEVSAPAQLLFIRLADYLGDNQKPPYVVRPHMATLARSMGHKEKRSTRRLIKELEDANLIERNSRRSGKQGNIANSYVLVTPADIYDPRGRTEMTSGGRAEVSAHKETSKAKETKKKDTTPISPKRGERVVPDYCPAIFKAICRECKLDPEVNQRSVTTLAVSLTRAGYSADHVHDTAEIVRDGWVDYTGPVTVKHIRERITESVPEEDREQIWR